MHLEIQRSAKKPILQQKPAIWSHIFSHFWFLEPLIKCSENEIRLCVTWQNTPRFLEYFAGGKMVCARVFSRPPSWKQSRPWERGCAIKCFRHYLCGRPFTVRTDHNALKCLQSFKEPAGQMVRDVWAVRLQDWTPPWKKKHQNTGAPCRNPEPVAVLIKQVKLT